MLIEIYKYANKRLSIPSGLFSFRRAPSTYEPNHRPSFLALILELPPLPMIVVSSLTSSIFFVFFLFLVDFHRITSNVLLWHSRQRPSSQSDLFDVQSWIEKNTPCSRVDEGTFFLLLWFSLLKWNSTRSQGWSILRDRLDRSLPLLFAINSILISAPFHEIGQQTLQLCFHSPIRSFHIGP